MTAPARRRLWTYAAAGMGWVGRVRRSVLLGWDVAEPQVFALCVIDPRTGLPLEWWLDRHQTACAVDGHATDWMWQTTRDGVPHVAVRPLGYRSTVLVREDALGRFLATTEFWVSMGREDFTAEVAELLGGAS